MDLHSLVMLGIAAAATILCLVVLVAGSSKNEYL